MNILLINIPSRKGIGGLVLPLGLLYVGGIIERCGHKANIVDTYLYDLEVRGFDSGDFDNIGIAIRQFKPAIIGYGGIATSYGRTKIVSNYIKNNYPDILQIAGGALASVSDLLLTKTKVSIVFHGEVERSLPIFLECILKKASIFDTPGISYLSNGKVIRNSPAEQIKNLDDIPFPAYHLVNLKKYLLNKEDWAIANSNIIKNNPFYADVMKKIKRNKYCCFIITSRGCTHKCLFCYRHFQGIRQHSIQYTIKHIKYIKENYGVNGFQFADELFNSNPKWVIDFCNAIEKENLNIFYMIGARIDKIDKNMLQCLRDTGCIEINYGQESGSDTILKEYGKGVTAEQNKDITALTKSMGIISTVQIVIGSPSETNSTIAETIRFLKSLNAHQYSLNYLIPLPETPIWKYVLENNLINDVEKYLDLVAKHGGIPLINLTKTDDKIWRTWYSIIQKEQELFYYKKTGEKIIYVYKLIYFFLVNRLIFFMPRWLVNHVKFIQKKLEFKGFNVVKSTEITEMALGEGVGRHAECQEKVET